MEKYNRMVLKSLVFARVIPICFNNIRYALLYCSCTIGKYNYRISKKKSMQSNF